MIRQSGLPNELIIYWSKEDQAFLVEVSELSGCMADGATYEKAVANARSGLALFTMLESYRFLDIFILTCLF